MGKSNKKVKSDRINALRKQYDAFLEEDKKRKERNDFILGRLDKMRYNTALVPVRHKPSDFEIRPAVVDRPEFATVRNFQSNSTNQRQQRSPDIHTKHNEETYLFQEISKKYILIPKLRTTFMNNTLRNGTTHQNPERLQDMVLDQDNVPIKELKPNSHDNIDWKSKYEILNILKNEEKEISTEKDQLDFVNLKQSLWKESSLENNKHQVAINFDNYVNTVHDETAIKHVNEYPEKDLTTDTKNILHATGHSVANTVSTENNNIFDANVGQTDAIGNQLQNITLEHKHSDEPNIYVSQEVTNYHELQPKPDVNMISTIADVSLKQSEDYNTPLFPSGVKNINVQDEYPVEALSAASLIHDQNVQDEYPFKAASLVHEQNVQDEYPVEAASLIHDQNVQDEYPVEAASFIHDQNVQDEYPVEATSFIHDQNVQDEYPVEAASLIHEQNVSVVKQHEPTDSDQVVYVNDISPMQAVNYNSPSTLGVNDGITDNENLVQDSNDQEYTPNVAVQMKEDVINVSQDQTYVNSNIETVDETEPVIEQIENEGIITESIDDFEAEQKEMFYSEQTDSNYTTQHGDLEHPLDYSQGQTPLNQEYAYYENTGAEAYPASLNEEEVTQQYDPSYDQQYTGLDQASEREQYGEQYQEPEMFTNQVDPQYDGLQYEQQFESQQEIEQSLNVEDGYTAQKPEAPGVEIPPDEEHIETDKSDDKKVPIVTSN